MTEITEHLHIPKIPVSLRFILGFASAGLLFAAYLSVVRLMNNSCSLHGCAALLGLPYSWFGSMFFAGQLLLVGRIFRHEINEIKGLWLLLLISVVLMAISGYFTALELPGYIAGHGSTAGVAASTLGLACAMLISGISASMLYGRYHD